MSLQAALDEETPVGAFVQHTKLHQCAFNLLGLLRIELKHMAVLITLDAGERSSTTPRAISIQPGF